MSRRLGGSEAQLDAVARAEYTVFDEPWRAAMRLADAMTPTPGIVSQPVYDDLASHWSAAQIVEITAVIAMFNFFNRFAHALAIPVTT
ncbi:MAG: carboxymuconolactone decarboxylase family protein [Polaromonas sp.]|nr:carboxymuconolactone decarboxylase family protein [Gemmatimonadaceae bacterium]